MLPRYSPPSCPVVARRRSVRTAYAKPALRALEPPAPLVDLEPDVRPVALGLDAPPARELVDEAQAVAAGVVADVGVEPRAGVDHSDPGEVGLEDGFDAHGAVVGGVAD